MLQDLGLRWPEQIDIAGFGAFVTARLYRPPLTLIAQPARAMGEQAVQVLLDQVEGTARHEPMLVILRNRLIRRQDWLDSQGHAIPTAGETAFLCSHADGFADRSSAVAPGVAKE